MVFCVICMLGGAKVRAQTTTNAVTNGGTINSGTTALITNPATSITGAITNNGSLQFWQSGLLTDSLVISGTGSLSQAGTGTTTLSAVNTFTGGTFVNAGTLVLNDVGGSGNGVIRGSLTINTNATVLLTNNLDALGEFVGAQVTNIVINQGSLIAYGRQVALIQSGFGNITLNGGLIQANGGVSSATATNLLDFKAFNFNVLSNAVSSVISGRIRLWSATTFTVAKGATNGVDLLISAAITENGGVAITKTGAGKMVFAGANSYTGATTISAGTLVIGDGTTNGTLGINTVQNDASLVFNRSDSYAVSNVILGAGSLTQAGTGTLQLTSSNTYSGGSFLNAGTLAISNNASFGTGAITFASNSTVQALTNLTVTNAYILATNVNATFLVGSGLSLINSGVISGSGTFTVAGTGTTILTGNNTYSGGTLVNAGTLILGLAGYTNHSTLFSNSVSSNATLVLSNANTTADNLCLDNSTFAGSGTLAKTGLGYLTLWQGTSLTNFTGVILVSQGTLSINLVNSGSVMTNAVINIASGATFDDRYSSTVSVGQLTGSGTLDHSWTDALTFTFGYNNSNSTFSGAITQTGSGAFSMTKVGTGTQILSGTNSYTGSTTVSNGVLVISGLLGSGNYSAVITNSSSLVMSNSGSQTLSGIISGTGSLTMAGNGTTTLSAQNTYTGGTFVNAGMLVYDLSTRTTSSTLNSNTIASGATLQLYNVNAAIDAAGTGIINSVFSGSGTLMKSGGRVY